MKRNTVGVDGSGALMRELEPAARGIDGPRELEERYFVESARHLRANFVVSLDGAVETDGGSSSLSGPGDRAAFLAMRVVADVIMVGAGTVRDEQYGPVRLDQAAQERRRDRGQPTVPSLAIVSNRGELDPGAKVFGGDRQPVLLTTALAATAHPELADVADVVVCGDEWLDVRLALDELGTRGLGRVLCEGGPTLFRSLVAAQVIDELCLTHSPVLAGAGHHTLLGDQLLVEPALLRLMAVLEADGMLLARYSFANSSFRGAE